MRALPCKVVYQSILGNGTMSVSKRNLFIFGAIGSVAVSAFSSQAIAVTLPAATFGAATTVNNIRVDGGPGSSSTHFSHTTDFGQGTISSSPLPTMNAIAQESSTNTVTVGLSMTYFFPEFVGPVTQLLPSQPSLSQTAASPGQSSLCQDQAALLHCQSTYRRRWRASSYGLAPLVPAAVVHWALHFLR